MATYTSTELASLKSARTTLIERGAAEVEINGRRVKYLSLDVLDRAIERAEAQVNVTDYGYDIAFGEVTD